jgi:TPR repeat protein/Tfp pilus assembly protein PilF
MKNPRTICRGVAVVTVLAVFSFLSVSFAGEDSVAQASRNSGQTTNRLTVAVVGFENRTGNPSLDFWRFAADDVLWDAIRQVKAIHLESDEAVSYGLRRIGKKKGETLDRAQARRIGAEIEARRVVWGSYRCSGTQWQIAVRVLNVATGRQSRELKANSGDWFDLRDKLVAQILQQLGVRPMETERENMRARMTKSPGALQWLAQAQALQDQGKSELEQEQCIRKAIQADPHCADTLNYLAAALGSQGKMDEAEQTAQNSVAIDPNLAHAHQVLGALLQLQGKYVEAEKEEKLAAQSDPDGAESFFRLGEIFGAQGLRSSAMENARQAVLVDPFSATAHGLLGRLYAADGRRNDALGEMAKAMQFAGARDLGTEQALGETYEALHDVPSAVEHYEKLIKWGREDGVNPKALEGFAGKVRDLQAPPITVTTVTGRPEVYTEQSLAKLLSQKLTPEEMALVKNPLASSPGMNAWARQITAGTTNEMQKAKMLFDELTLRVNTGFGGTRTAQEVFAAWKAPEASFCCEEYASLYVALARAAGLQAFLVDVIQQYSGSTPRHACAAVFIGDDALLVDPTIPWFGVPHRSVMIMDDVQALAAYMVQAPGLRQHRIAYKLAPDLSVVESNFYLSLMSESQWDEARKVLDAMPAWHTEAWVTNFAQARWALHEGKPAAAASLLRQAIQLNPCVGVCRRMLGDALSQQGKLHEARKEFHDGLVYLFDDFNIASVRQSIVQIDETLADHADQAGASARSDSEGRAAFQKDDAAIKMEVEQDKSGANAGDVFAMMLLARRYERANGVDQDYPQAAVWFRKAAEAGNTDAMSHLGAMYAQGVGVTKAPGEAMRWFEKAADAGNVAAMNTLGIIYYHGQGVEKDYTQAQKWFRKGAEAGDPEAMLSLSAMYLRGQGVETDYAQALAWSRKAADAGNGDAMSALGKMYLDGDGVAKDEARAFEWYERGANAGSLDAMSGLGWMYTHGIGIEKDYAKALAWLRKAAEAANSFAMHELGLMYLSGQGVEQNDQEAAHWFQKGAEAGDPESMNDLGTLYSWGKGVAKDDARALIWYRKSAEAGNPPAMLNLGSSYENGQGTKKDEAEAIRWYRVAEKAGMAEAAKRLESLTNSVNAINVHEAH